MITNLINLLNEGNFACVIQNKDEVRTFSQRGVADLYQLYTQEREFLQGATVVDKIVGKAAATLMIAGGVKKLHTNIISQLALDILQGKEMEVSYNQIIPHVINRDKSGWCPMETLCKDEQNITKLLQIIDDFQKKLKLD